MRDATDLIIWWLIRHLNLHDRPQAFGAHGEIYMIMLLVFLLLPLLLGSSSTRMIRITTAFRAHGENDFATGYLPVVVLLLLLGLINQL